MNPAVDMGLSLMRAGFGMLEAGVKFGEMMIASHSVIGRRVDLIQAAARNPLLADYAELGRMVPEKVAAFTLSGAALAEEWRKAQSELFDQWSEFGALMTNVPTMGRISAFHSRSSQRGARAIERPMRAGGLALEPVHRAATRNARRLQRTSRKRRG